MSKLKMYNIGPYVMAITILRKCKKKTYFGHNTTLNLADETFRKEESTRVVGSVADA